MVDKNKIKAELQEIRALLKEIDSNMDTKAMNLSFIAPGKVIELKFRDFVLVIKKIGSNIFEIIENGDSLKIKEGDLLKIKEEIIQIGNNINFEIFRKTLDYKSDILEDVN